MAGRTDLAKTGFSRIFTIEDGAAPANAPAYQGLARGMNPSKDYGAVNPVFTPSASKYDSFDVATTIRAAEGLPTVTVEAYDQLALSELFRIVDKGCALDLQFHWGQCETPNNFNSGWLSGRIDVFEGALGTTYGLGDIGSLDSSRAMVMQTIPFTAERWYQLKPLLFSSIASTELTDTVVAVAICDAVACGGICGAASDGKQIQFAVVGASEGSPGLPTELLYTSDAWATVGVTNIDTLGLAENVTGMACVGDVLVVVSNDSNSLHWASIADILDGSETWAEVTTGFAGGGEPNAIFSFDPTHTWIVGDGGYVYFTADPTSSVSVQSSGGVTTQNLLDVTATDEEHAVAVGVSNAILYTESGGDAWSLITGPAAGVTLNAVAMQNSASWLVGANNGSLYYTRNTGADFTEKSFPGSGAGVVRDVIYATRTVAYLAHDTAANVGRIFRSIDGGFSWYALPEAAGQSIPANQRINALAAPRQARDIVGANYLLAGGLATGGLDGILLTAS